MALISQTFYSIDDFIADIGWPEAPTAHLYLVPINIIQFQFRNVDPKDVLRELTYLSDRPDHLIVATGDYSQRGAKNHFGNAYLVPYTWLDRFTLLALESTDDLLDRDIGIMPVNALADQPYFNHQPRRYLYSFLGQLGYDLLPEQHVRNRIGLLQHKEDVLIKDSISDSEREALRLDDSIQMDDYELVARNSTFTLCPAGFGKWTYRFFQAICWASIPVLLSDGYVKPFAESIPYDKFSLTLPEDAIQDIDAILRAIPESEILSRRMELEVNQRHFTKGAFFQKLARALEERAGLPRRGAE